VPRLDTPSPTRVACAQCGRAPRDDRELRSWRHGALVLEGGLGDADGLVLCPDCSADDAARAFDEGAGA
jgi:hypothetical protein